ncbi:hypothetical protein PG999_005649 [Apiospora kogelbergensis]|uniref:Uncharacterized protein n=1 Tax=Apiospora kogelbergensis TaxID=1337665 RepID=A0AAW0R2Q0_9PEZI
MQQQPLRVTTLSPITDSSSSSRPSPPVDHLHARQQRLSPPRPSLSPPPPLLPPPPPPPPLPPGLAIPITSVALPATDGSTAAPRTTTPTTIPAAPSTASSSNGSSSQDQGLTAGAIVGIAVALHIVLTIVLVLLVRAYRRKHRKRKETGRRRLMAGRGDGGVRRQQLQRRTSSRGSRGALFQTKRESGGARPARDANWIKLQDKATAAAASDAAAAAAAAWPSSWRSSTQHPSTADGIDLPPPDPAVLSPTSITTYKSRTMENDSVRAGVIGNGDSVAGGRHRRQVPSYRTSSCSTFYHHRAGGEGEEPIAAWNDARWNEVLYRTLEEPPRSQAASVSQVSLGPCSYYGDDEEEEEEEEGEGWSNRNSVIGPSSSSARSLRPMHSRRRLVDDTDSYHHHHQTREDEKDGHEVIRIGHRPEGTETEDSWGGTLGGGWWCGTRCLRP